MPSRDDEALGAMVVDVTIPDMDDLLSNTGLIDFEFKFDLMTTSPACPTPPVSSLEETSKPGSITKRWTATSAPQRTAPRATRPSSSETMERRAALTAAGPRLPRTGGPRRPRPTRPLRAGTALIGARRAHRRPPVVLSAHTGLPALTNPPASPKRGPPRRTLEFAGPLSRRRPAWVAFRLRLRGRASQAPRTPSAPRLAPGQTAGPPPPVRIATDPPAATEVDPSWAWTSPPGTLSYRITISEHRTRRRLRHGSALRTSGDGRPVVVLRLGGPEEPDMTGAVRPVAKTPARHHERRPRLVNCVVHTQPRPDHRSLVPLARP